MQVGNFIRHYKEAILREWDEFAGTLVPAADAMTWSELRDSAAEILDAIADDMESDQTREEQRRKSRGQTEDTTSAMSQTARIHAADRLTHRFELDQVIAEYRALRASVVRLWTENVDAWSSEAIGELIRFDEAIDESLAIAVAFFNQRLREAEAKLRRVEIRAEKHKYRALKREGKAKDEFLAILAHELRNPLAPIRSGLDLLERAPDDVDVRSRVVPIMSRQVSHLVRLVDDLLDISRLSWGKIELQKETLNLNELVEDAIEQARHLLEEKGHRLHVRLSEDLHLVSCDRERLTQVLTNLLSNATKYTEANGDITVTTGKENGRAWISIRDSGRGIDEADLERVFDKFTQLGSQDVGDETAGLGIGLTLCDELVRLHDGAIEAKSAGAGAGSEFVIRLPIVSQEPGASSPSAEIVERVRELRILVVDDNVDAAEGLRMVLELEGHEVRTAHSGSAAVQAVEPFQPQVVLLDLGMPGMSGLDVAREIRSMPNGDAIRLVAVTGWAQDADRQSTQEAGFDRHLLKPLDLKQLRPVLADLESD